MKKIVKNGSVRDLAFFHDFFNFEYESFITSNSYLFRRKDIPENFMINNIPKILVGEDRAFIDYLYYSGCEFVFNERVTSLFTRNVIKGGNASSDRKKWEKESSLYTAFLKKSKRMIEYVEEDTSIKTNSVKHGSRFIIGLKFVVRKLVPHRIRKYILLMVKELVSSSANI